MFRAKLFTGKFGSQEKSNFIPPWLQPRSSAFMTLLVLIGMLLRFLQLFCSFSSSEGEFVDLFVCFKQFKLILEDKLSNQILQCLASTLGQDGLIVLTQPRGRFISLNYSHKILVKLWSDRRKFLILRLRFSWERFLERISFFCLFLCVLGISTLS